MRTIRHYIDRRAEEQPDKICLIAPEPCLTLTYRQLKEDSIELGKHLLRKGMKKGDKISFMLGNGYQTTKIFLGAMYSGFVIAPLNLLAQPSQLEYVLEHSDTKLVFFTADQQERLEKACRVLSRKVELIKSTMMRRGFFRKTRSFRLQAAPGRGRG
jgi:acyl-CoA synthetase (AMP-forming)/AMP-acid ligase II